MGQANMVLSFLAKQPFEQVADLIVELRNQAQTQIQAFQAQHGGNPMMRSAANGEASA